MADFRNYLEREGVDTGGYDELPLFVRPDKKLLAAGLVVPRIENGNDFAYTESLLLEPDPIIKKVRVDMSIKVQALESSEGGVATSEAHSGNQHVLPNESLARGGLGAGLSGSARIQGTKGIHQPGCITRCATSDS